VKLSLKVSDIWKEYGGVAVLRGCSFSFDRSGVYALMGANGSGKSTFLRICALLEKPDRGDVQFFSDGGVLAGGIGLMRRMTLLLPDAGLFNATVFNNAAYGLRIRGFRRSEIEERVKRVLAFTGLENKRKQNALTLSSGEAQRLGLARAMAILPEMLFLDEPTASVDRVNREIIENIILKMKEDNGSTVVITTHDVKQAERLADTLLVIEDGKITVE
jgi:ABC-type multidrug transport system ATPase subunit